MSYKHFLKNFFKVFFLPVVFVVMLCGVCYCDETYSNDNDIGSVNEGVQVAPFGKTLFVLYGNIGGVTVENRSEIVSKNIKALKNDLLFNKELLTVKCNKSSCSLVYMDKGIVGITEEEQDAADDKSKEEIANEYRDAIINAIEQARAGNMPLMIAKQAGLALLIIVLMYFIVKYINRLFVYIQKTVLRGKTNNAAINNLIDVNKQVRFVNVLLKFARIFLIVVIVYGCALILLEIFPDTRWLAHSLEHYLWVPLSKALNAIWNYLPDLFAIIVIVVLCRILDKTLKAVADKINKKEINFDGFHSDWAYPTYNLVRIILVIFMFIFIFPHLPNAESGVFKGISVFMGVLISLGSTSLISNIVAGVVITYMRPFQVGDVIKMGEHVGVVIEKTSLVTRIKTPKNEIVTIPNSNIMTAYTVNYTVSAKEYSLILHSEVTISYDVEWRKVHEMLIAAALKTKGILSEPKPFVMQHKLQSSYVQYQINAYTKDVNRVTGIYSDLFANMLDVFNAEGVELLAPEFKAVRDGNPFEISAKHMRKGSESDNKKV